jgi:hypothetical protein
MAGGKIATIEIVRSNDASSPRFAVTVREGASATRHDVTVSEEMLRRLAQGRSGEKLIEAAFRFLLEREAKESILARFDVSVIGRYFPEFERELPNYLDCA